MLDEQPENQDSPTPKVIDAPLHIWLVYGEIEHDGTHAELARHDDGVTWCEDKQFESDVLYVRADYFDRRIAEALKTERKRKRGKRGHNEVIEATAHMKRMESALKALQNQARIRAVGNLDNKAPT